MNLFLRLILSIIISLLSFEKMEAQTHTLTIKIEGEGYVTVNGIQFSESRSFELDEGKSAYITYFCPSSRLKSMKVNGEDKTGVSSINLIMDYDIVVEIVFVKLYKLDIVTKGGGGYCSYEGKDIVGSSDFTLEEGEKVTISFIPYSGYQVKSVKVNNSEVEAANSYSTIMNSNIRVEVQFEKIPPATYTLTIMSSGGGYVSYNREAIRNTKKSYSLEEGTYVKMSFNSDENNQIKSIKVDNSAINISNSYQIWSLSHDTTVEVEFEAISNNTNPTTYSMSISSTGNGSVSYNGESIRKTQKSFSVSSGTEVKVSFSPDDGNRLKSVQVNGSYVSASSSCSFTVNSNTTVNVEFEAIPVNTYELSISVRGNGVVSYNNDKIREGTNRYSVTEGSKANLSFSPDTGNQLKSVKVNNSAVTVSGSSYTISNITSNTTVDVLFEELDKSIAVDGMNYEITSFDKKTVLLSEGNYGITIEIPEDITYQNQKWKVAGIKSNALDNSKDIAAIIWNPQTVFEAKVDNPNLLLYVKKKSYAPSSVKNVVVDGYADNITLTDARSGNNFYCPKSFTAQSISYTHSYGMTTGIKESKGWETIALPFDVQKITHSSKGEIVPFIKWNKNVNTKPFWLYQLGNNGFVEADAIKANTPYIISMPNHNDYISEYRLAGSVLFSAENVKVEKSDDVHKPSYFGRTFIPNYTYLGSNGVYALNVSNDYESYQGVDAAGSKFILNLREIRPFEAYMISSSGTRSIEVFEGMVTSIQDSFVFDENNKKIQVYNLKGQLIFEDSSFDKIKQQLPKGVYLVNQKKIIIK